MTDSAGAKGTGYLGGFQTEGTDYAVLTFTMPNAGLYNISVRYLSPYGPKEMSFKINAQPGTVQLDSAYAFNSANMGKFQLPAGTNTLEIDVDWGYFFIDDFTISPAVAVPPAQPTAVLSDTFATCNAQALYGFLLNEYGKKVLTGQQDLADTDTDIDTIFAITGKYPALGSFDLLEYSPSRRLNGSNPDNLSEKAIAFSKLENGHGIISLMWHWNAPTDLVNTQAIPWWEGFYNEGTTFDLAAALADTSSANYKLLISDMDSIAVQLRKFSDANIPVLWRPLHEPYNTGPTGFWWGNSGAASFIQLWKLMHDRYVNHYGFHNLIWVLTNDNDLSWYPGDAYVDIVGLDLYQSVGSSFSGDWDAAQALYDGKKLVTLSETGTLPVPDDVRIYGTWWSWFNVWNSTYIESRSHDSIIAVYNDPDFLTLDELPDWEHDFTPGSCGVSTAVDNANNINNSTILYPNPAQELLNIQSPGAQEITVLNSLGQPVISGKELNTDLYSLSVAQLEPGIYFVKITSVNNGIVVKSFVKSR
jgi:mannan endo-1,4-beta-mannosidase